MATTEDLRWPCDHQLPERKTIIDICETAYDKHLGNTNHASWPINEPLYFIKFGADIEISEARNQRFAFEKSKQSKTVCAPEVFWAFTDKDHGFTYIVAEYVVSEGFASLRDRASALVDLIYIPPPTTAIPGPIGGGFLHHPLFKDGHARKKYNTVADLQKHINHVSFIFLLMLHADLISGH